MVWFPERMGTCLSCTLGNSWYCWVLSFYSVQAGNVCLVCLRVFIDSLILFTRLVLVSDLYTASPLGVRE